MVCKREDSLKSKHESSAKLSYESLLASYSGEEGSDHRLVNSGKRRLPIQKEKAVNLATLQSTDAV